MIGDNDMVERKRWVRVWGVLLLSFIFIPFTLASPGSFTFSNPDYYWISDGATYLEGPCSWNTLTLTPTLFDFTNFYWASSGVTWSYFGFSCDTVGETMNITGLTVNTVTLQPSIPNTHGRIWANGMSHVISVTGASYTWDYASKVVSFISDGSSPNVVITFGLSGGGSGSGSYLIYLLILIPLLYLLLHRRR
jgi:hypothetical protein